MWKTAVLLALLLLAASCSDGSGSPDSSAGSAVATSTVVSKVPDGCADVVDGSIEVGTDGATVSATVRSADTGWDKYADAWEVRSPDGQVLGVRELAHPHENEQPFTRTLSNVEIPESLNEVVLIARDSVAGWCGETFTVAVPARP